MILLKLFKIIVWNIIAQIFEQLKYPEFFQYGGLLLVDKVDIVVNVWLR